MPDAFDSAGNLTPFGDRVLFRGAGRSMMASVDEEFSKIMQDSGDEEDAEADEGYDEDEDDEEDSATAEYVCVGCRRGEMLAQYLRERCLF